jgi:hypothetical protein
MLISPEPKTKWTGWQEEHHYQAAMKHAPFFVLLCMLYAFFN